MDEEELVAEGEIFQPFRESQSPLVPSLSLYTRVTESNDEDNAVDCPYLSTIGLQPFLTAALQ